MPKLQLMLKTKTQEMYNAKDFGRILETDTESNKCIFIKTNCNAIPVKIKIPINSGLI